MFPNKYYNIHPTGKFSDQNRHFINNTPPDWGEMVPAFCIANTENRVEPTNPHKMLECYIKEEPMSDEAELVINVDPILTDSYSECHSPDESNEKKHKTRSIKEKTVVDEDSRTCKTCGKILASISSLHVHLKSHSKNKPFNCHECGATFTRKYYLEVHLRSHTGERPFQCEFCQKHFSQKSSLNTHKRKHTGEKPYQCHLCGKSFSAQSYLSSHQWSHYARDQSGALQCTTCNDNFTSRAQLIQHMKIHAGSSDFECELCFKRFSKEAFLMRHKKTAHVVIERKSDKVSETDKVSD